MDVAVTGSGGMVGSALTEALRGLGHRVRRVVRREARGPDEVRWDPAAGTIDAAALAGVDGVVHLAAAGIGDRRWSERRKEVLRRSRVDGTRLIAETLATLEPRPQVLVSASAVGYYGDRGDEVLTEESGPGDDFVARLCVDWEAAATPAAEAGVRTVLLRSGPILDPRGGLLDRLLLPFRLGVGGRLASGRQYMPWVSIRDELGVIAAALTDDACSGPVNVTAPEPVRNEEFTRVLGRVLRRPTIVPIPRLAVAVVYGGEAADVAFLASQRVVPERLQALGYRFEHPDLEGALRDLLDRPAGRAARDPGGEGD